MEIFIAAIIALFFWGKTTKDVEEKTELSSPGRTFIYFFFSLIVGVFFYKTYQVATLFNYVSIQGVRLSHDSLGNVVDTVSEITIDNKFETGRFSLIPERELKEKFSNSKNTKYGGTYVKIRTHNYGFTIRNTDDDSIDYTPYGIPKEHLGQVGRILLANNYMPSLIPIYPSFEDSKVETTDGYKHIAAYDLKKHPEFFETEIIDRKINGKNDTISTDKPMLSEGSLGMLTFATNKNTKKPLTFVEFSATSTMFNSLGFFTAADVSQYTQVVQIESNCPVSSLNIGYDIPIETEERDSDMQVEIKGFTIKGKRLEKMVNKAPNVFLVKMPTLSNLQLIRSLILTTLLTALVSLFLSNLFYCVRKVFVEFRNKHMDLFSEARVKSFWKKMYLLIAILLIIIAYLTWCVLWDAPIHISVKCLELKYIIIFIIATLLIIVLLFYYIYKQVCKSLKK